MTRIYKITNQINKKVYVGVTTKDIKERWEQHQYNSKFQENKHRPLYLAMNKYGIANFKIELIEEVENQQDGFDKEIYWIKYYDSFKNGYNATLGGDGRPIIDHDLVINTYRITKNMDETAKKLNISTPTVKSILKSNSEKILTNKEAIRTNIGYSIEQYTLDDKYVATYNSIREAYRIIRPNSSSGNDYIIGQVCKGNRQSAYGFKWRYKEEQDVLERQNTFSLLLPTRDILKQEIRTNTFTSLGRKYNVCDETIRKWCIKYNLPRTKKEINSYSEQEWNDI